MNEVKSKKRVKTKAEHYFTEKPTSKYVAYAIEAVLRGKRLKFKTASGMFSPQRIDKGTELLINSAIIDTGWSVLDLGCGYGPVGIAIKKAFPSATVVMSDINERAVAVAKENAEINKVTVDVRQSEVFSKFKDAEKFDTILLNPPQTAGKKVCFQMIEESIKHLKKDGLLQMVARHKKGGKSLSEKMEDVFGNVEESAKRSGYRIYVSKRV